MDLKGGHSGILHSGLIWIIFALCIIAILVDMFI